MGHLIAKLTWVAKEFKDFWHPKNYTRLELFVPVPTRENPEPCIIVSIRNGKAKLFFRVTDLAAYSRFWTVHAEGMARIENALKEAWRQSEQYTEDDRLLHRIHSLPPGSRLVEAETGEIVAQAEGILNRKP